MGTWAVGGGVRTGKKIFPEWAKYSLVLMIVRWKLWLRGCSQKQKSRGLLISSTGYVAFDPFWGPKMGRFWPSTLVERGEGGRIFIDGIWPGLRLRTRGAGGAASCKNFPKVPHGAKRDPER